LLGATEDGAGLRIGRSIRGWFIHLPFVVYVRGPSTRQNHSVMDCPPAPILKLPSASLSGNTGLETKQEF
jgi:hypothetical protein